MTIDRKSSSIEANFSMENMEFDDECRTWVKDIREKKVTVADSILELNQKYGVSKKDEW